MTAMLSFAVWHIERKAGGHMHTRAGSSPLQMAAFKSKMLAMLVITSDLTLGLLSIWLAARVMGYAFCY